MQFMLTEFIVNSLCKLWNTKFQPAAIMEYA